MDAQQEEESDSEVAVKVDTTALARRAPSWGAICLRRKGVDAVTIWGYCTNLLYVGAASTNMVGRP